MVDYVEMIRKKKNQIGLPPEDSHSNYLYVQNLGGKLRVFGGNNYGCYSALTYSKEPVCAAAVYFPKSVQDEWKEYMKFIFEWDIFKGVFTNTSFEDACEDMFFLSVDTPLPLMTTALCALRMPFEDPNFSWKKFKEFGFSNEEALCASMSFAIQKDGKTLKHSSYNTNHVPFRHYHPVDKYSLDYFDPEAGKSVPSQEVATLLKPGYNSGRDRSWNVDRNGQLDLREVFPKYREVKQRYYTEYVIDIDEKTIDIIKSFIYSGKED